MHPMLLHFPLVLVLIYSVLVLTFSFRKKGNESYKTIGSYILLIAALSAALTALTGLLLSREKGYDPEALQWHKWSGAAVSFLTLAWSYFSGQIETKKIISSI